MSRRQERMSGSIAWMARNPVAANLLMAAIVIGGSVMAFFQVREEVFPQVEPDLVQITVPYPGASPAEVEQGILLVVEEAVRSLDGVKEVTAVASEGVGSVSVELETGADKNKALADIKNAVDRIVTFPKDAEEPIVMLPKWRTPAISVVLYGDQSDKVLHALAEKSRDELLALPEISYVELQGVRPLEIAVEVPQRSLRAHGVTLPQIADKIRRTALELPAGGLKTPGGEVLLRTDERRDAGAEFSRIPIMTTQDGTVIELGDIASVSDGFAETDVEALYESKPAVSINVFSVGDESPIDVAKAAKQYSEGLSKELPPGVKIATWQDLSELYAQRLDLLLRNAQIGLVLVLVILGLFLEPRLAFWVTMGIPISFMGCFLLLPAMAVSLNMVSLFAFIVTLGMVVDDAIVVGENVFRHRREGVPAVKAAVLGAREVAMPVFFSVATTLAAFTPLLFIPGNRGKFMYVIPVVVILVLVFSLIESFFILPAHLSHLRSPRRLWTWLITGLILAMPGAFIVAPALGFEVGFVPLLAGFIAAGYALESILLYRDIAKLRRGQAEGEALPVAGPVGLSIVSALALFGTVAYLGAGISSAKAAGALAAALVAMAFVENLALVRLYPELTRRLHIGASRALGSVMAAQELFSAKVERFVERYYAPVVGAAVRQRWYTLAVCVSLLLASTGLIAGGIVKFVDWPQEESDWIVVNARLPFGAPIDQTREVMEKLVDGARTVIENNGGEGINRGIYSVVGAGENGQGSHYTIVVVNLVPTEERPLSSSEFVAKWREAVGPLPLAETISFDSSTGHSSPPIDIELSHRDIASLESAAAKLATELASFPGVSDIDSGIDLGKPQYNFKLTEQASLEGLTAAELAAQVRAAFYGSEALRQQRGRNEVRVMVRLPRPERETLATIDDLIIITPSGGEMPLAEAAQIELGRAYTSINRVNGRRTIRVKADVDEKRANTQEIMGALNADALPGIAASHTGLSYGPAGRQKSMKEFFDFLKLGYALALLAIFVLIAIPLRSYAQPLFVVMVAIPFGFFGLVMGHFIMGYSISMISLMGLVALSGVVVNDSLVFVAAANVFRDKGLPPVEAAIAAGKQRFRPIMLTSLTTFGGLTPMIFETSVQARILIPMAVSLGFGVLFATFFILLLVPALFVMIETPRGLLRSRYRASLKEERARGAANA